MSRWLRGEINSIWDACKGVVRGVTERHIIYHWFAALSVTFSFFLLPYSYTEIAILCLTMAFVICLEYVNTAIEKVCDATHPNHHPLIGLAKDLAAGAVLISSITALVIGVLIIAPKLFP